MIHKLITTILFLTFSYSVFATEKPYPFWLAEKNGKKVYMLGTIHLAGLKEYQCPSEIKNRIESSDLVFTETGSPIHHILSVEDRRTLMIGSESEKQDVLNKLPTKEDRIKISKAFTNRYSYYSQIFRLNEFGDMKFKSERDATFEDLNSQTQEFLINHGFKPSTYNKEDFLKETLYFLYLTTYYDAFFDVDQMDNEVILFAKSNKTPLRALDNNNTRPMSEKEFQDKMMSKKTIGFVGITGIEDFVESYDQMKESFSLVIKNTVETVLSNLSQALYQNNLKEQEQTIEEVVTDNPLLKNRNIIWVEKINQALNTEENNTIFVAGGAAHFLGPDNVIDMLKEASFNIKKLHCSEESLTQD